MRRPAPLLAVFLLALSACAGSAASSEPEVLAPADSGPAFSIPQPPSGALSRDQLTAIAADIRRIEARPLAAGAADGRRNLFRWVVDSPDVSVSLCQGVVGPLVDSNNPNTADLLNLFILSSAAHQIETSGADRVATNVAGLEGALAAYTVMLSQQGRRARNSFLEKTRERRDGGTLAAYVRSGVSGC